LHKQVKNPEGSGHVDAWSYENAASVVFMALLACGGVTHLEPSDSPTDARILDEYRVKCKSGCHRLESLVEETDGQKPCLQAREHNGMDCVEYCVYKMETDSSTNPDCWKNLKTCGDFEEQCHFGEIY
jgi:hypothetical protein